MLKPIFRPPPPVSARACVNVPLHLELSEIGHQDSKWLPWWQTGKMSTTLNMLNCFKGYKRYFESYLVFAKIQVDEINSCTTINVFIKEKAFEKAVKWSPFCHGLTMLTWVLLALKLVCDDPENRALTWFLLALKLVNDDANLGCVWYRESDYTGTDVWDKPAGPQLNLITPTPPLTHPPTPPLPPLQDLTKIWHSFTALKYSAQGSV